MKIQDLVIKSQKSNFAFKDVLFLLCQFSKSVLSNFKQVGEGCSFPRNEHDKEVGYESDFLVCLFFSLQAYQHVLLEINRS